MLQPPKLALKGRNILVGISGGIAAYKIPQLVRLLKASGANVRVITTEMALRFVTAETLSVVSENPVLTPFFDPEAKTWNNHVDLGLWADAMLIAPCGANTLSKLVNGQCDNLLLTAFLSARCPVWIAPAMDLDMFQNPAVQQNLKAFQNNGGHIIEPEEGPLASGLVGKGRMAEPETLAAVLIDHFCPSDSPWVGKTVLVTAGPTHEAIDPVRFIGNRSSGLMGIELAEHLARCGAQVHLVLGPTHLQASSWVETHRVESALDMLEACQHLQASCDMIIMAAAVADYRPETASKQKIKKSEASLELQLIPNPDILSQLSHQRSKDQCIVGFALETENAEAYGQAKLHKKKLDAIVINQAGPETGFGHSTNKVILLHANGQRMESPLMNKSQLAPLLIDTLAEWFYA
ncbi:MAG: bifunctional phosphopantothenoylcysteine decarboxylase/phosphopantothenate--cysteine ligase CoaBC [Bacteroidia bacterium]